MNQELVMRLYERGLISGETLLQVFGLSGFQNKAIRRHFMRVLEKE